MQVDFPTSLGRPCCNNASGEGGERKGEDSASKQGASEGPGIWKGAEENQKAWIEGR